MDKLFIIFFWFLIGGICFRFAKQRGRNPHAWFAIGLFLGVLGVILLFLLPPYKAKVVEEPKPAPVPPPSHLLQHWYYLDASNRQYGPMSFEALSSSFKEGKVIAQTYVWNETFEEWKRYGEVIPPQETTS
jgi:hypothetical protein